MLKRLRNFFRKLTILVRTEVTTSNWVTYSENGKMVYDGPLEGCPADARLKMAKHKENRKIPDFLSEIKDYGSIT